jgi:hypothetical protein
MRKLWLSLVLLAALPLFSTDHPVTCGDAAGLTAAVAAAVPGDTITLRANNGAQCTYTLSTLNLPTKVYSHPTAEAVLDVTISGGAVTACSVTSGGTSYTIAPSVRIVGGGGTGASAHVTISAGAVNACVVDSGGSQYWGKPSLIPVSTENYITIQTDQTSALPPPGRRYQIANHVTLSPKLVFTGTSPITITAGSGLYDGAAYWKIRGLEMTISSASAVSVFAALDKGSHFIFDQNYIYPQPCPNTTAPYNTNGRIVWSVKSYDVQLTNNYLDCFYGTPPGAVAGSTGQDTMGPVCDSYCEGVTFDNNYDTAWFNGIFLGGGDPPSSSAGSTTIASRTAGAATLTATPPGVSLMALEIPFEGNTVAISSITRASNVVTVVTSTPHGFLTGALVYPKGVTDTSFNVTYDGNGGANCTVKGDTGCRQITVVNSTTFTYQQFAANATSSGGVIIPTTCQTGPATSCFLDVNVSSIVGNTVNFAHAWVSAFAWGTFDIMPTVPGILVKSAGTAQWDGPQATNVDVLHNQFQRNSTFDLWVAQNNGSVGKGCPGEFKFWNGGRMEGNVCAGFPLNTPGFNGNSSRGSAPWVKISNVNIVNNWWQRWIGNSFTGFEYEPIGPGERVDVINNLWMIGDNDNQSNAQGNIQTLSGPSEYATFNYKHNTVLTGYNFSTHPCTGGTVNVNGDCKTLKFGFIQSIVDMPQQILIKPTSTIIDNIMGVGSYGYQCGDSANRVQSDCSTLTENHNLMVSNSDGNCILGTSCNWTANQFPWTNSTGATTPGQPKFCSSVAYPCMSDSWNLVRMTNPQSFDFRLQTTSPGYHNASDGTDIGANYTAINAALGPDNPTLPGSVTIVTVSPTTATIPKSGTQQFTTSASSPTWTVNSGCTGSVSAVGFFSATTTAESCTVTATSGANSGSATVTVQAVTVTPSAVSLNVGATQQFISNFTSTWSASCGTISGSGLYTAPSTNGSCTITATAINGGSMATATATISGQVTLIPLSISPTTRTFTTTISTNVDTTITATNIGTGSVTPTVVLSGSSKFSKLSDTCNATPVAGSGTCTVVVRFNSATVGVFSAGLLITDTAGGSTNVALNASIPTGTVVTVSPTTVNVPVSGTQLFSSSTSNGSAVAWTASCGSVSSVGTFTAPASANSCVVTATAQDGSNSTGSGTANVLAVAVSPLSVTMQVNAKLTFTANFPSTWTATCGTITSAGLYTAPAAPTSCVITAHATNGGSTGTAAVSVVSAPATNPAGKITGSGNGKKFN